MRKFFIFSLVISTLVLAGCSNSSQENDLALKEKCTSYLSTAKSRINKMNNENEGRTIYTHFGTYYSNSKKNCITKYKEFWPAINETRTNYYDELTGQELVSYPQDFEKSKIEFEKTLELL